MEFPTKAIHMLPGPDANTGAVTFPIYQTSTFARRSANAKAEYEYSRTANPTRDALQDKIAALENGAHCLCFSSGVAATDALLRILRPGDEVIVSRDLYGGSYRLMSRLYQSYGIHFSFIGMDDESAVERAITPATRLLWIETPSNPLLKVTDIMSISNIAKRHDVLLAVDSTFASPCLQNPLALGADVVVHSVSKYIGGHSDLVLGALVLNDDDLAASLAYIQNAGGAIPGPQDCFLALRGVKTLDVRMERHCGNAMRVAEYLQGHSLVSKVFYPGLRSSPGHAIASRQMRGFGGMVSFELQTGATSAASRVVEHLKLFTLAESLGGVESLCSLPALMSHASFPPETRLEMGVSDSLIRLSVGIEHIGDLLNDLFLALEEVS